MKKNYNNMKKNKMEQCNCEEITCSSDCNNSHTHKTHWCKLCLPDRPELQKRLKKLDKLVENKNKMDTLMERFDEEVQIYIKNILKEEVNFNSAYETWGSCFCKCKDRVLTSLENIEVRQLLQSAIEEVVRDVFPTGDNIKEVTFRDSVYCGAWNDAIDEIIQKARDNWGIDLSNKE